METVIHNVGEMSASGRSAAETLVGHALAANQRLVIQVVEAAGPVNHPPLPVGDEKLPGWCDIYAGLSDEQIQTLEEAVSRRLDLTR
jgi:hypothetical protein